MNKQFKNYLSRGWLIMNALAFVFLSSCAEDEPDAPVEDPIASFQYEVSEEDFLQVSFSNFSQNATSYEWDFGDGNSSEEEDPTHTYEAAGSYEVTLTATNEAGVSAEKTETITLEDANSQLTALTGGDSKTWILQRQGVVLGIGPAPGATDWWSFGGVTPHAERPCILDDEYTFNADGSFELETNGTVFLDGTGNGGWNDTNPDVCNDEATADWTSAGGQDMSAYQNGGDYTYTLEDGILTISGDGVYIGLPNKTNSGDIGSESSPQSELVYSVVKIVDNDDVDSLHLALQINGAEEYWTFFLVHYDDESLMPELPNVSPPAAIFSAEVTGLEATFTNNSTAADTYTWDFGDGNTSSEVSPVHTYASAGVYSVTLTAVGAGGEAARTINVMVGASDPAESDIQSKDWQMYQGFGSVRVGPAKGSGEWFTSDQAWADAASCMYDDTFTFNADGSFVIDVQDEVFTESAMEGIENNGCVAVGDLPSNLSGWGGGSFTYEYADGSGDTNPTLTVEGNGAYIGFYKGANGAELAQPEDGSITYEILNYVDGADADYMEVAVDISENQDGTAYWTYLLKAE